MKRLTYEDVKAIAEDEAQKVVEELTEESIRASVREILASKHKEAIMTAVGFTNKWGKWEVDRGGNRDSAVDRLIRLAADAEFQSWFDSKFHKNLSVNEQQRKAVEYAFNSELQRRVDDVARERAAELASKIVDQALAGAVGPVIHEEVWEVLTRNRKVVDEDDR